MVEFSGAIVTASFVDCSCEIGSSSVYRSICATGSLVHSRARADFEVGPHSRDSSQNQKLLSYSRYPFSCLVSCRVYVGSIVRRISACFPAEGEKYWRQSGLYSPSLQSSSREFESRVSRHIEEHRNRETERVKCSDEPH